MASEGPRKGGIVAVEDLPGGIPLYIEAELSAFLQAVLEIDEVGASVTCGAGVGGDFVTMEWGDRQATFYLRDVLKAWVGTFEPSEAERLPGTEFDVNFEEPHTDE